MLVDIALKLARRVLGASRCGFSISAPAAALSPSLWQANCRKRKICRNRYFCRGAGRRDGTMRQRHGVAGRIQFSARRSFRRDPEPEQHSILIVSNPPYIRRAEIAELAPEMRRWEPRGALDGGSDGLDYYRRHRGAGVRLPSARVALSSSRSAPTWAPRWRRFSQTPRLRRVNDLSGLRGQDRVVVARKSRIARDRGIRVSAWTRSSFKAARVSPGSHAVSGAKNAALPI